MKVKKITKTLTFKKSGNETDYVLANSNKKNDTYIVAQCHNHNYSSYTSTIYLTKPMLERIIKQYNTWKKEVPDDDAPV